MTTTIVIGNGEPIKLGVWMNADWCPISNESNSSPSQFKYIELICRNYRNSNYDLIFAYDDPNKRHLGMLWTGKWNDGIVAQ